jgi:hypothetical protein
MLTICGLYAVWAVAIVASDYYLERVETVCRP